MGNPKITLLFSICYDNNIITGPRGITLADRTRSEIKYAIETLVDLLDENEDPSYFFFQEYDKDRIDYKIMKQNGFRDKYGKSQLLVDNIDDIYSEIADELIAKHSYVRYINKYTIKFELS